MSSLILFNYNTLDGFEGLFDGTFNARARASSCSTEEPRANHHVESFRPRINVKESKDWNAVTATFDLPGLKPEEITIKLEQNRLTVSGSSSASNGTEKDGYLVRERRHGKFSRTLQLPFGTKVEDVKAKLENGVLTVTFPKSIPDQEPQRILIQ